MTAVGIQNVVQDIHMVQHSTGTLGHAVQRVLSHMDIDAGLALNELVEAAQPSPSRSIFKVQPRGQPIQVSSFMPLPP